jgi:hypothetical protein
MRHRMGKLRVIPRFKRQSGPVENAADRAAQSDATIAPESKQPAAQRAQDQTAAQRAQDQTSAQPSARLAGQSEQRLTDASPSTAPAASGGATPGATPPTATRGASPSSAPAATGGTRPPAGTGAGAGAPSAQAPPGGPGAPATSAPPTDQPTKGTKRERAPGFRTRGRMRRRLQYLRTARELSYRDLGGLTFDLYRFGGRREELMAAKLERLLQIDTELRALERALDKGLPFSVLREAGVVACPRCAEVHSEEDNFCPHCGMPVAPDAERPLATAPSPPGALASPAERSAPTFPASPASPGPPAPSSSPAPSATALPTAPPAQSAQAATPAQAPTPTPAIPATAPPASPAPASPASASGAQDRLGRAAQPPAGRQPYPGPPADASSSEITERLSAQETRILRSAQGAQGAPDQVTRILPAQEQGEERAESGRPDSERQPGA